MGGIQLLRTLRPSGLPRVDELAIDGAVFGLALGMSVLAALLAGAVPALRAARRDPEVALRSHGRTAGGLADLLYEVTADDPVSFGAAAAVLLAAALAAARVSARRAMAVEPAETLRGE